MIKTIIEWVCSMICESVAEVCSNLSVQTERPDAEILTCVRCHCVHQAGRKCSGVETGSAGISGRDL